MTGVERRWASSVFTAVLPAQRRGWPPEDSGNRQPAPPPFWRALSSATPPFGPGLRAMLWLLMAWPLFDRRFLRPFPLLSPARREEFLELLDQRADYISRQLIATFKILACFARFDVP